MMRWFVISVLALIISLDGYCQELNCKVTVDYSQVQGTNTSVFKTLENAIAEYFNTRKWTQAQFSPNERIDCTLFLTIKSYEEPHMTGELQIQSTRPVYNSSYNTTVINFKDTKVEFDYQEGEPLIFSENTMESNLTAILNFYAYFILAMDFDTFALKGGDAYFSRDKNVVNMAQSGGESGWKAFEDTKNRSAVLSAYTDAPVSAIRELYYNYHRNGLDEMSISPEKGRAKITETLAILNSIYEVSPMTVALSMFKDAKMDELVNIYYKAPQAERDKVHSLLEKIYPTETTRLEMIKKGVNK